MKRIGVRGAKYWYFFCMLSFFLLLFLDRLTKLLAVDKLMGKKDILLIPGVLHLHYLENRGAAFGILQDQKCGFILIGLVFLAVSAIILIRLPKTDPYKLLAGLIILLAAGAAGNMIDRSTTTYVVDFIYLAAIHFPVFNLADIYVTCGGILLVWALLFYYKDEEFDFLRWKKK